MTANKPFPPSKITAFHRRLHAWYGEHGRRGLPWRNTQDPYHIYLSEIMLQQTQVKTVLERYYHPFLERFPTLQALAGAARQEVMKAWEGLGYYSRAGNLHQAAQVCGGTLPRSVEALLALPGIGQNTAHAVAAFAYRHPVPVMEANVKRVLSRVFALSNPKPGELWERATLLLDLKNPFDYNQAMMDIGALVCTKTNPSCVSCPLGALCMGKAAPAAYPAKVQKKRTPARQRLIVAVRNARGQYWVEARRGKFLQGLYGFCELEAQATHLAFAGKRYRLAQTALLGHVKQTYSHFTLQADVRLLQVAGAAPDGGQWADDATLGRLPLSRADEKVRRLLAGHHSEARRAS